MSKQAFGSILFPVDFSEASAATAPHVRGLADQTGASVVLVHAIPWLSGWYSATELRPPVLGDPDLRKLEEQGTVALESFRKKYFSGITSHREVVSGAVAESIVDKADSWGVDLIMMPTRGLGRSRPFLIGSTTAKVLYDARCAVWTSPHLSTIGPFHGYKTIVCTVDGAGIPRGYLEEAARLASILNSKLIFATAVPRWAGAYGDEPRPPGIALESLKAEVHQIISATDCSLISETGSVGDVIRDIAEIYSADLVLTNRGHMQHQFGRFRTHAYEIMLESPCPVLSLSIFSLPETRTPLRTDGTLQTTSV